MKNKEPIAKQNLDEQFDKIATTLTRAINEFNRMRLEVWEMKKKEDQR